MPDAIRHPSRRANVLDPGSSPDDSRCANVIRVKPGMTATLCPEHAYNLAFTTSRKLRLPALT